MSPPSTLGGYEKLNQWGEATKTRSTRTLILLRSPEQGVWLKTAKLQLMLQLLSNFTMSNSSQAQQGIISPPIIPSPYGLIQNKCSGATTRHTTRGCLIFVVGVWWNSSTVHLSLLTIDSVHHFNIQSTGQNTHYAQIH